MSLPLQTLKSSDLRLGQMYAGRKEGAWYRVIVQKVISADHVSGQGGLTILWNHTYSLGPMFVDILLVSGDIISWVTGLRKYNAGKFITSLNVHGDVNLWVRVTHEIHEFQSPTKNNDSTVLHITACSLPY